MERVKLFHDHFQNYKVYGIPKAQLVLTDIPYNVGNNAYGSNPQWYVDGDNKNGESEFANATFFDTDKDFRVPEFLHFCSKMLKNEPKDKGQAPCMIVFCSFEQQFMLIEEAKKHGLNRYINLVFRKTFSAQVLKANMRIVGNCEYGLVLYRDKLPKFNNNGHMVFNCFDWPRTDDTKKIHPTQKPVALYKWLLSRYAKPGDRILDTHGGSGSICIACHDLGYDLTWMELDADYYSAACARYKAHAAQGHLFDPQENTPKQGGLYD